MKDVQQWTAVICLAALVAALAQSILPPGSMERMGKFVVGAFMICVMIAPLTKIAPQLRMSFGSSSDGTTAAREKDMKSAVNNQVMEELQKSIANLVTAELSRRQIKCKNVQAIMDTNTDGRIFISKIIVKLKSRDHEEAKVAEEYLEKELGLKTEVVLDDG